MKTEIEMGKQVELGDRVKGEIELPTIDITPYIGRKAKIASVTEYEGNFGYYIKVETEVIDTIDDIKDQESGEPLKLTASRIFGLQEDANGAIGWGKDTKLGNFLRKMKVEHYKELIGKEVIVQSVTNKKDGRDYLSFN